LNKNAIGFENGPYIIGAWTRGGSVWISTLPGLWQMVAPPRRLQLPKPL
jgi:hypothetical protein